MKYLKFIISFCLLCFPAVICAEDITSAQNTLIVSIPDNVQPFMYLNSEGNPAGMFADIWRLWAQKTGRKIKFLPAVTFKDSVDNVRNGKADVHAGLLDIPEQYKGISFSQHFYEISATLFFPVKYGKVVKISELAGELVGAVRGSSQEGYLKRNHPEIRIADFGTRDEMIHAAKNGKVRACVSIAVISASDVSRLGLAGEFEFGQEILYTKRFCAGVPDKNKELLTILDKGFDAITDKEFAEIEKRWIPHAVKPYFDPNIKKIRLTAEEQAWLNSVKTVRFGFMDGFPPITFSEGSEYKGIHNDYLKLIGERTGIRFEYVPVLPTELDLRAKAHEFDMFPSFNISERKSYVSFTTPLMEYKSVIITRNDEPFISGISTLKNKKVTIVKGLRFYKLLFDKHPDIRLIEKKNISEALKAVSDSEADAYVGSTILACWQIQQHNLVNLRIAGIADHPPENLMYAVRKDYPELLSIMNKGIDSISKEEHEAILQKWFVVKVEHKADWSEILRWAVLIGSVFIAILGMSLFWNRRLAGEIDERRQAEDTLKINSNRFYTILSNSYAAILLVTENGDIEFINQSFCDLFNLKDSPEELRRLSISEMIAKIRNAYADPAGAIIRIKEIVEKGQPVKCEEVEMHSGRTVLRDFIPISIDGERYGRLWYHQEITERKRMEDALRKNLEKYDFLVNNSSDYISQFDRNGVMLFGTEASIRFNGYTQEEIRNTSGMTRVYPDDRDKVRHALKQVIETGVDSQMEFRAMHKKGNHFWIEMSGRRIYNDKGEPEMVAVFRNISERKQAEKSLRRSFEKLKELEFIVNKSHAIAFLWKADEDWSVEFVSDNIRRFGYLPEDFTGGKISYASVIHPDDVKRVFSEVMQHTEEGYDEFTQEYRIITKYGNISYIHDRTWIRRDENGAATHYQGVILDITKRKKAEDSVRMNEARLESLLRISQYKTDKTKDLLDYALSEAISLTGSRIGYIYYYNESNKEFSLNTWSEDVMKECAVTKRETLYHLDKTGIWGEAVRQRRPIIINDFQSPNPLKKGYPEGHVELFRFLTVPVIIEGEIVAVTGVANKNSDYDDSDARQLTMLMNSVWNIAERKRAENALLKSERHYHRIISSVPVMLYDYILYPDGSSKFLYVGPSCMDILELDEKELLKDMNLFWKMVHSDDLKRLREEDVAANREGRFFNAEVRIVTKSGCLKWIQLSSRPNPESDGESAIWTGFILDITERKQAEEELHKAKAYAEERSQAAEAATRAKSEFLANMSHEIRTPLNAIIGFSRIVFNREIGELNQTQSEYLGNVIKSSEHLLSLINDILDFSKIEAGKLELENIDFNLLHIVGEVIRMSDMKASEKGIQLSYNIADTPSRLRGDPMRLKQILLNLVNNAIKFTPKGRVTICISSENKDELVLVRFSVSDTGIGIPKDRLARLFQAFSQADMSTTRKFGGTGLGLAISKAIVEKMNGQIGVESEEGKGTTFRFTAEFEKCVMREERVKCDVMKEDNLNISHNTSLRILLVEDNKLNQKLALHILKKQGFEADVAENGREAIRALQTVSYDIVLMDIQMPEMDGLEATKFIRNSESEVLNPNVPIIAMTANAMKSDREACFHAGMNDYLSKPIEAETLLKIIQRQLNPSLKQISPLLKGEGAGVRSVFDKTEFSKRMGSNEAFCKEMTEAFVQYFPDMIENLKKALNENDAKTARLHAHSLKGSCSNMSAHRLSDIAAEMELFAKNSELDKVRSLMGKSEEEVEMFISVLKKEYDL